MEPGSGKVKVCLGSLGATARPSARPGQQRGPRPGRGLCRGRQAKERGRPTRPAGTQLPG